MYQFYSIAALITFQYFQYYLWPYFKCKTFNCKKCTKNTAEASNTAKMFKILLFWWFSHFSFSNNQLQYYLFSGWWTGWLVSRARWCAYSVSGFLMDFKIHPRLQSRYFLQKFQNAKSTKQHLFLTDSSFQSCYKNQIFCFNYTVDACFMSSLDILPTLRTYTRHHFRNILVWNNRFCKFKYLHQEVGDDF